MSQVAPEELRALLKDAIVEASDDRDVEPSSSDEESATESSVASDTVQEIETDDDGNEGNRTGAGNAGKNDFIVWHTFEFVSRQYFCCLRAI